ncbi:hypothetical protein TREMEDRAFT_62157 [Tremella mesenterica DSM 1558]|uniref:uncharacterized protein n=1 Tax=Tremella mesenterica (strain ATCC 24925 / CBS 8224 / DSM 1558 / NBRC 9311 / NRRL Y-6157 / RJB 2259-6 / UBC 559-6) TaxID=578456 RepID=UPI0003F492E4|nr:uncharacterized protein TREMEDRAFT_62157 [Tremella mesenterica DSM 1558]EIW69293.1 hypothetical protein TREMEDRAFT_62157 [Tremella mesenterica DSM 1558]
MVSTPLTTRTPPTVSRSTSPTLSFYASTASSRARSSFSKEQDSTSSPGSGGVAWGTGVDNRRPSSSRIGSSSKISPKHKGSPRLQASPKSKESPRLNSSTGPTETVKVGRSRRESPISTSSNLPTPTTSSSHPREDREYRKDKSDEISKRNRKGDIPPSTIKDQREMQKVSSVIPTSTTNFSLSPQKRQSSLSTTPTRPSIPRLSSNTSTGSGSRRPSLKPRPSGSATPPRRSARSTPAENHSSPSVEKRITKTTSPKPHYSSTANVPRPRRPSGNIDSLSTSTSSIKSDQRSIAVGSRRTSYHLSGSSSSATVSTAGEPSSRSEVTFDIQPEPGQISEPHSAASSGSTSYLTPPDSADLDGPIVELSSPDPSADIGLQNPIYSHPTRSDFESSTGATLRPEDIPQRSSSRSRSTSPTISPRSSSLALHVESESIEEDHELSSKVDSGESRPIPIRPSRTRDYSQNSLSSIIEDHTPSHSPSRHLETPPLHRLSPSNSPSGIPKPSSPFSPRKTPRSPRKSPGLTITPPPRIPIASVRPSPPVPAKSPLRSLSRQTSGSMSNVSIRSTPSRSISGLSTMSRASVMSTTGGTGPNSPVDILVSPSESSKRTRTPKSPRSSRSPIPFPSPVGSSATTAGSFRSRIGSRGETSEETDGEEIRFTMMTTGSVYSQDSAPISSISGSNSDPSQPPSASSIPNLSYYLHHSNPHPFSKIPRDSDDFTYVQNSNTYNQDIGFSQQNRTGNSEDTPNEVGISDESGMMVPTSPGIMRRPTRRHRLDAYGWGKRKDDKHKQEETGSMDGTEETVGQPSPRPHLDTSSKTLPHIPIPQDDTPTSLYASTSTFTPISSTSDQAVHGHKESPITPDDSKPDKSPSLPHLKGVITSKPIRVLGLLDNLPHSSTVSLNSSSISTPSTNTNLNLLPSTSNTLSIPLPDLLPSTIGSKKLLPSADISSPSITPLLPRSPNMSKRSHLIREIANTERSYANDLALIRDAYLGKNVRPNSQHSTGVDGQSNLGKNVRPISQHSAGTNGESNTSPAGYISDISRRSSIYTYQTAETKRSSTHENSAAGSLAILKNGSSNGSLNLQQTNVSKAPNGHSSNSGNHGNLGVGVTSPNVPKTSNGSTPYGPLGVHATPQQSPRQSSSNSGTSTTSLTNGMQPPIGKPLSPSDLRAVFLNLEQIAQLAEKLAAEFENAIGDTPNVGNGAEADVREGKDVRDGREGEVGSDRLGEVFTNLLTQMRPLYIHYCARQSSASAKLQELSSDQGHKLWLEDCWSRVKPHTHAWNLESMLIKPVQRITKYPMLFDDLLSSTTPVHPDYFSIRISADHSRILALEIDEAKRRKDLVSNVISPLKINSSKDKKLKLFRRDKLSQSNSTSSLPMTSSSNSISGIVRKNLSLDSLIEIPKYEIQQLQSLISQLDSIDVQTRKTGKEIIVFVNMLKETILAQISLTQTWSNVIVLDDSDLNDNRLLTFSSILESLLKDSWMNFNVQIRDVVLPIFARVLENTKNPKKVIGRMQSNWGNYEKYFISNNSNLDILPIKNSNLDILPKNSKSDNQKNIKSEMFKTQKTEISTKVSKLDISKTGKSPEKDKSLKEFAREVISLHLQLKEELPGFIKGQEKLYGLALGEFVRLQMIFFREMNEKWGSFVGDWIRPPRKISGAIPWKDTDAPRKSSLPLMSSLVPQDASRETDNMNLGNQDFDLTTGKGIVKAWHQSWAPYAEAMEHFSCTRPARHTARTASFNDTTIPLRPFHPRSPTSPVLPTSATVPSVRHSPSFSAHLRIPRPSSPLRRENSGRKRSISLIGDQKSTGYDTIKVTGLPNIQSASSRLSSEGFKPSKFPHITSKLSLHPKESASNSETSVMSPKESKSFRSSKDGKNSKEKGIIELKEGKEGKEGKESREGHFGLLHRNSNRVVQDNKSQNPDLSSRPTSPTSPNKPSKRLAVPRSADSSGRLSFGLPRISPASSMGSLASLGNLAISPNLSGPLHQPHLPRSPFPHNDTPYRTGFPSLDNPGISTLQSYESPYTTPALASLEGYNTPNLELEGYLPSPDVPTHPYSNPNAKGISPYSESKGDASGNNRVGLGLGISSDIKGKRWSNETTQFGIFDSPELNESDLEDLRLGRLSSISTQVGLSGPFEEVGSRRSSQMESRRTSGGNQSRKSSENRPFMQVQSRRESENISFTRMQERRESEDITLTGVHSRRGSDVNPVLGQQRGINPEQVHQRGIDAAQVHQTGVNHAQVHQRGVNPAQVHQRGIDPAHVQQRGTSKGELRRSLEIRRRSQSIVESSFKTIPNIIHPDNSFVIGRESNTSYHPDEFFVNGEGSNIRVGEIQGWDNRYMMDGRGSDKRHVSEGDRGTRRESGYREYDAGEGWKDEPVIYQCACVADFDPAMLGKARYRGLRFLPMTTGDLIDVFFEVGRIDELPAFPYREVGVENDGVLVGRSEDGAIGLVICSFLEPLRE